MFARPSSPDRSYTRRDYVPTQPALVSLAVGCLACALTRNPVQGAPWSGRSIICLGPRRVIPCGLRGILKSSAHSAVTLFREKASQLSEVDPSFSAKKLRKNTS